MTKQKSTWPSPESWDKTAKEFKEGTKIAVKRIHNDGKIWVFFFNKSAFEKWKSENPKTEDYTLIPTTLEEIAEVIKDTNCPNRSGVSEILKRIEA